MACWYIARPNELLLDLDAPKLAEALPAVERMRRRVREAIAAGALHVESVAVGRSGWRRGNAHAIVTLSKPYPPLQRLTWQLALGSDVGRAAKDFRRLAIGHAFPSLLITRREISGAREPDNVCACSSKHALGSDCYVWAWYRGDDTENPFGERSGRERSPRVRAGTMAEEILLFKQEV